MGYTCAYVVHVHVQQNLLVVPQSVACTLPHCDLRGQIKGTARTFTSFIVRSVRYDPYRTFNNKLLNDDTLARVHPIMVS